MMELIRSSMNIKRIKMMKKKVKVVSPVVANLRHPIPKVLRQNAKMKARLMRVAKRTTVVNLPVNLQVKLIVS